MKIIAHRGCDGKSRDNSFEAIINSLNKYYVDGVEFDIRMTKDEIFVINHDPFYEKLFIKDTDSKYLRRLGINTLEEVLKCIENNKIIMIEVKVEDNIEKNALNLNKILNKYKLNYYICSFNYDFIIYFKNKYNIKSGLIIGSKKNTKHIKNNLDFNSISYKYREIIPKKQTFRWTVNEIKDIEGNNIITDRPKEIYEFIKKKIV